MKPNHGAVALAAALTNAASAPLQTPERKLNGAEVAEQPEAVSSDALPLPQRSRRAPKMKELADTVQMTLRPRREVVESYVCEAAERSKREGRMISAQQIMLEVLETGPKVKR